MYIDGNESASISEVGIATGLAFRPCLGQSEIKAFIDTEPKERWKQISAILGLGGFEVLRDKLMRLKTDTEHYPEVAHAKEMARRAASPLIPPTQQALSFAPESLKKMATDYLNIAPSTTWASILDKADKEINKLLGKNNQPKSLELMVTGQEKIETTGLKAEVDRICSALGGHREWHASNKQNKFIKLGIELSEPPKCPYCGEDTLTTKKLESLRSASNSQEKEPPEINEEFIQLIKNFAIIKTSPVNIEVIGSLIDALPDDEPLVADLQKMPEKQEKLQGGLTELGGLARGFGKATSSADFHTPIDEVTNLGSQVMKTAGSLAKDYNNLRTEIQQLKEKIQAKFSGLTTDEKLKLEGLQSYKKLATDIGFVQQAWAISQQQAHLEQFTRNVEQSERSVVQSKEAELAVDVKTYYSALSNSQSLEFKGFKISSGVRRQATLEATSYNVPVNPTSMFSEAQGNCLGLSLYFSQRVKRNPGWHAILLDDPVQSMDEDHKENLISLLNSLQNDYQLLVFTHDKEFKRSLSRQFTPQNDYLEYEIVKSDSDPEPEIEVQLERFEQLIAYAGKCSSGPSVQRESAFTALRKAIEVMTRELGQAHNAGFVRRDDLRQKINKLLNKPLDSGEVGTLQRIKGNCDPNSHDSSSSSATGTINNHINELRTIYRKYN